MMKMATGEGFPLRQGAWTGLDWLSMATEASGGRTPDLLCFLEVLGYMDIYRRKKSARGATRRPRGWRARPLQVSRIAFFPKITLPKVSSVWTPFDIPFLRNTETREIQELALGFGLIG